jgi:hypothetical protein
MRLQLIIAAAIFCFSHVAIAQYRADSCGCPRPINDPLEGEGTFGRAIPIQDFMWSVSSDGRHIGYLHGGEGLTVLNMQTLEPRHLSKELTLQPGERPYLIYHPWWSPYDPDVLMFKTLSKIDTGGKKAVTIANIYKYNIATRVTERMTPPSLGRFGPTEMDWGGWLRGSRPENDTLLIGYPATVSPDHKDFYGWYLPETGEMTRIPFPSGTEIKTNDSKHIYIGSRDSVTGLISHTLDGIRLKFPHEYDSEPPFGVSFSPNGEYVAFDVIPPGSGPWPDTIHPQVWISRTEEPTKPITIVNLQRLYCMYSFAGIFPRFTSDSTLAISMHKDEAPFSPLWEIALDGRLIRQLTRLDKPQKVRSADIDVIQISITPNPTNGKLTIDYESKLSGEVMLSVYSVNGVVMHQEVIHSAGKPIQLDTSGWPSGAYAIVLRSGDDEARGSVIKE